jgi:hypothetical protein
MFDDNTDASKIRTTAHEIIMGLSKQFPDDASSALTALVLAYSTLGTVCESDIEQMVSALRTTMAFLARKRPHETVAHH